MTNFKYITTQQEFNKALSNWLVGKRCAVDTETYALPNGSALDPHTGRVSLLITQQEGQDPIVFDCLHLAASEVNMQPLFDLIDKSEYLIGANLKFDLKMLRSSFGYVPASPMRDCIIMGKMISNATGSKVGRSHGHSLADLCREYLSIHLTGKKTLRESTWNTGLKSRNLENDWWVEKLGYGARDVMYLFELHDIMYKAITLPLPKSPLIEDGSTREWGLNMKGVLDREMDNIAIVADIEYDGMPANKSRLLKFQAAVSEELNNLGVYLSKELNLDTPKRDITGQLCVSPRALKILRSSSGLLTCIQKALNLKKIDNVQASVLKRMMDIIEIMQSSGSVEFIDEEEEDLYGELLNLEELHVSAATPILKAILDFKRLSKQDGMDLRKFINPVTGNIHASYDQIGAATSRMSSSRPNAQQISSKTKLVVDLDAS